jgi:hypothetical protein
MGDNNDSPKNPLFPGNRRKGGSAPAQSAIFSTTDRRPFLRSEEVREIFKRHRGASGESAGNDEND